MSMAEKSISVFKLLGAPDRLSKQKIVFIRAGESVAEVFPDWIEESELGEGYYLPFDLNIPIILPKRSNLKAAYKADPPLSEIGKLITKRVVKELFLRLKTPFKQIYTSPTLACLQTARDIQQVFRETCQHESKLKISNLLATDGAARKHWMSNKSLKDLGYNLDENYERNEPFSTSELNQENVTRNIKQFLKDVSTNAASGCPVLIVCDSIAMALMVHEIRGKTFNIQHENVYEKCMKMFPASSTFVCDYDQEKNLLISPDTEHSLRPFTAIGVSSKVRYDP